MTAAAFWWVNSVDVETYLGSGGTGDKLANPVPAACWLEDEVKLVRAADGSQIASNATLYAPLDSLATFAPKSRVTLPSGRRAYVIVVAANDSGSLELELDHIVVSLT